MKYKSVNAYVKPTGAKIICVTLENDQVVWLNEGLVKYACINAKPMKAKESK